MNTNVVMFREVADTSKLFRKIDRCSAPITIAIPSGSSEDLRKNRRLQETIVTLYNNGPIPELDLNCDSSSDWVELMRYMIAGD